MSKFFWITLIILALLDGFLSQELNYDLSWWHGTIAFVLALFISSTIKNMKNGVGVGKFKEQIIGFNAYILKGKLDGYVEGHFYRYDNDEYKAVDIKITKYQLITFLNTKDKEVEEFLRKNLESPDMQMLLPFEETFNSEKEILLKMTFIHKDYII